MDIRKVKKLIELLEESGIAELEIAEGDDSVRISRYGSGSGAAPAPVLAAAPPPALPTAAEPPPPAEPPVTATEEDGYLVTAPMVGTFYAAATPGAPAFVQIGDRVNPGDTLCILEAMKMMNQIEAEVSGVVKSIRSRNGEAVEFGQVLFVIDQRASS